MLNCNHIIIYPDTYLVVFQREAEKKTSDAILILIKIALNKKCMYLLISLVKFNLGKKIINKFNYIDIRNEVRSTQAIHINLITNRSSDTSDVYAL